MLSVRQIIKMLSVDGKVPDCLLLEKTFITTAINKPTLKKLGGKN